MRIGIFGGSFNPVHRGHLKLAQEALAELNLKEVFFVPSSRTPLKKEALLPASLRVAALKKAIQNHKQFTLSLVEIKKKGLSYSIDTVRYFRKKYGKKTTLYVLTGADNARSLKRWRSFGTLRKLSNFVVCSRPGESPTKLPAGVSFMPFDALNVSSTDIRRRLNAGISVKNLVPQGTESLLLNYFKKQGGSKSKSKD